MARYEMLWDCSRCDTPKLLGVSHRHCPACGAPQDPEKRYYPKDEDKVAVEDHPYAGVDVACPGCDAPNSAAAKFCVACGAPTEGAKPVRQKAAQTARSPAEFAEDSSRPPPPPPPAHEPKKGIGGWIAAAVVLALIGGVLLLLWKKEAAVTVTAHAWSREIAVERMDTVTESAWRDELPGGARVVSCAQAQRSTKKVADGQDCKTTRKDNGDGSFTESQDCTPKYREEPVYAEKCSYQTEAWKPARVEKASGSALTDVPRWPPVSLARTGTCVGCEREGKRTDAYTVKFQGQDGRELSCDLPEAKWSKLAVGSKWKVPVGVVSASIDCASLAPL